MLFDNSSGSATIQNNGTSTNTLGAAATETIIITNGGSATNTLTISALIGSGTGSLTKAGGGTLIVSGANTYTGSTVINEGMLQLSGNAAALGATLIGASSMTVRQNAFLDLNGAGVASSVSGGPNQPSVVVGAINGAGTIENSGGGTSAQSVLVIGTTSTGIGVFSGIIKDNGGIMNFTKAGTLSTQYLTGDNTYTGVTTLSAGILKVFKLANIGFSSGIGAGNAGSNAASLVFNGGTLMYAGTDATTLQLTQTPTVATDRLFTLTTGGGTIDASPAYGGSVLAANQQNLATLVFSNTGAIAFSGSGNRTLTLQGNSTGDNEFKPLLQGPVTATAGVLTGTLALTKTNAGLWILTPATSNTYSGATTVSGGALQVAAEGASVQSLPTNSLLTLSGGVLQSSGNFTRTVGSAAGNVQS